MGFFQSISTSLLDASVVRSFDRNGYERHARTFSPIQVSLKDKICLVTGSNSGIGKALALRLAQNEAEVWLLCRNPERAQKAQADIIAKSQNQNVHTLIIDLADLDSIQKAVQQFSRTHIDALVHNAGVLPSEHVLSPQGFEQCFACNVLGPYALTQHLRPKLSEKSRIVFVSSGGMYPTRLSLSLLENPKKPYSGLQAYSMTKRAQVVLAELWQQSLPASVYSMHPGWADTPAVRSSIPRFYRSTQNILRTPEQGADTLFYLLASDSPPPAGFYFDRKIQNPYPLPFTKESPQTRRELLPLLHRYIDAHASSSPREA